MGKHIVIDGNAFYEVDEDCLRKMGQQAGHGMRGCTGETEGKLSGAARRKKGCSGSKDRRDFPTI